MLLRLWSKQRRNPPCTARRALASERQRAKVFVPLVEAFKSPPSVQENHTALVGKDPYHKITFSTLMSPDTGLEIDPTYLFERSIADRIDAPEIQRLRSVRQLSGSYIAFPGVRFQ